MDVAVLGLKTSWWGNKPATTGAEGSTEEPANPNKDKEDNRREQWPHASMDRIHGVEVAIDHDGCQRQIPQQHNNFATHLAHVFLQKFVQRRRPRGYGGRTHQIKSPTSFRARVAVASQRARGFSDIAEAAAPNVACGQRLGLPPFSGRNMPATKSDTPT